MYVKEAMTSHAEWVAPDLTLTEVARRMRDNKIGCLPVGVEDKGPRCDDEGDHLLLR